MTAPSSHGQVLATRPVRVPGRPYPPLSPEARRLEPVSPPRHGPDGVVRGARDEAGARAADTLGVAFEEGCQPRVVLTDLTDTHPALEGRREAGRVHEHVGAGANPGRVPAHRFEHRPHVE